MLGLLGKKIGMTQLFDAKGNLIGCTAVEVGPCTVLQKKSPETDGYHAVQLGFGNQKQQRMPKAELGHLAKANVVKDGVAHCAARVLGRDRLLGPLPAGPVHRAAQSGGGPAGQSEP